MPHAAGTAGGGSLAARGFGTLAGGMLLSRCSGVVRVWAVATALLLLAAIAVPSAGATPAPRLRGMLKQARIVVAGEVTNVTPYDDDRVAVVQIAVAKLLKGTLPADSGPLAVIELHEGPARPRLLPGVRGIAFLRPVTPSSYLGKVLPRGTYYELLPAFEAFVAASTKSDADRDSALIARLVSASRGAGLDAEAARQLTFDLLASANPALVEDTIPGVADLRRQPALSSAELATLRSTLQRADLPDRVRVALIQAVAAANLRDAVPVLQSLDAPPAVAEAAWQALDKLGAPPPEESVVARLADREPSVRAAAARELLRRDGSAAISQIASLAVDDPDPSVRLAVVDALGALGKPEALPPLERVFPDSPTELRQASARAIMAVGGPEAVDTLGRLAFVGPLRSQRFAVFVLMTMTGTHRDEVVQRIGQTHSDAQVRDLVEHGLPAHDH